MRKKELIAICSTLLLTSSVFISSTITFSWLLRVDQVSNNEINGSNLSITALKYTYYKYKFNETNGVVFDYTTGTDSVIEATYDVTNKTWSYLTDNVSSDGSDIKLNLYDPFYSALHNNVSLYTNMVVKVEATVSYKCDFTYKLYMNRYDVTLADTTLEKLASDYTYFQYASSSDVSSIETANYTNYTTYFNATSGPTKTSYSTDDKVNLISETEVQDFAGTAKTTSFTGYVNIDYDATKINTDLSDVDYVKTYNILQDYNINFEVENLV